MRRSVYFAQTVCCLVMLALVPAYADEQSAPDLASDAMKAEKHPPVISHSVQDDADGNSCNTCHTGNFKAPHPDRLNCTQCHVPGDMKKASKKSRKKS